jgi:hypothetical protein
MAFLIFARVARAKGFASPAVPTVASVLSHCSTAIGLIAWISILPHRGTTQRLRSFVSLVRVEWALAGDELEAPIAYLLCIFLALQLATIAAVGLLIGLFLIVSAPLLNVALPPEKWRPAVLLLLAAAMTCIVTGAKQSRSNARYPWRDSIVIPRRVRSRTENGRTTSSSILSCSVPTPDHETVSLVILPSQPTSRI